MEKIAGLTEGALVLYVLPNGKSRGQIRPALIVKVWNQHQPGTSNLQVFVDGPNDYNDYNGSVWATSINYSAEKLPGTWHWPGD